MELVHDRQSKRAARQIGQAIGTEYPISSVNRLGFMVHLLRGDGLYPFLEELAGLRRVLNHRSRPIVARYPAQVVHSGVPRFEAVEHLGETDLERALKTNACFWRDA